MTAETTITVSGGQLIAITLVIVSIFGLQFWTLFETASRRRWVWLAAIWLALPIGTIAWLTYGRWRTRRLTQRRCRSRARASPRPHRY